MASSSGNEQLRADLSVQTADIVAIYALEAGLVQSKVSQILSIRTLAITLFGAVAVGARLASDQALSLFVLAIVPFYVLDTVYDAYLIPITRRESAARRAVASRLSTDAGLAELSNSLGGEVDHRITPPNWSPFLRAALEAPRVAFYGLVGMAFIAVAIA